MIAMGDEEFDYLSYEENYYGNNEDDYDEIHNSELSYTGKNICIVLNDKPEKRNKLHTSGSVLYKKYPKIKELPAENRLKIIIDRIFPEGFNKRMYIRNLTFKSQNSGYDVRILGIRPERTVGDGMDGLLPEGMSLLFKGHISGEKFIVDSIHETANTEQLDFEVDCIATPYSDPKKVQGYNFLYNILDRAGSLTKYTEEKLEEWKEYLNWKKELARRQIYGCKYYKVTFDENRKHLIFWLVFEDEERFQSFRKYLWRDIQVFDNNYSTDKWHFNFSGDSNNKKQRFNSVELGRCKGIIEEYYLKDNIEDISDENETVQYDQEEDYDEEEYYEDSFYDEEADDQKKSDEGIEQIFDNPYIVKVAYELNRSDLDEIYRRNLDDDGFIQYVYDYVLGNYYTNGFLALSAIGEFVLINRFSRAINQLERDECYSPNLAMWLFNVERARLPEEDIKEDIDSWLNSKIEKNENQKKAVYKMLAAPDLCLIQGPPGTGKTTIIAEAIYQFVRKGNRVLVASQSNDAVDNALERLSDTPEIRAIRLGQKGKRKHKIEDLSTRKFSEEEALKYYYNALSSQISRNWLNKWDDLENNKEQYDIDIRDTKLFYQDIAELNAIFNKQNEQFEQMGNEYQLLCTKIANANEQNTTLQSDRVQFKLFEDHFRGISEEQYYLSDNMLKILETVINPLIDKTVYQGIYMTPGRLDLELMGTGKEGACIVLIIKNLKILESLKSKIQENVGKDCQNDGDELLLQNKIYETKQKILECIESEDAEGEANYKKALRQLKKQKDELNSSLSIVQISDMEKSILSKSLIEMINSDAAKKAIDIIKNTLDEWNQAIEKTIAVIGRYLSNRQQIDIGVLVDRQEIIKGKYLFQKEEICKTEKQIKIKKQNLQRLRDKYQIESVKVDEIMDHIKNLKEENVRKLQKQSGFRTDWEKTLRAFKERLDSKDSFKYDQEYYQQIYVNSCNVVGISCTDNMRDLSDNGYDDFDVVIIDEVSKATPPELLIPLMKARKAILVGDHRQLPPMFKEHEGSYKELIQNQENVPEELRDLLTEDSFKRFKKMVTSSLFKDYFEQVDESIKHSLLVQYRMHSHIMNIINRFYEQRLENGLSRETEELEKKHGLMIKGVDGSSFVVPENHAYWIDSSCLPDGVPIYETFVNHSTSACNILEKYIIIELLKKIATAYKEQGFCKNDRKKVGVISFYQMQVNELRDAFKEVKRTFDFSAIDVDINTVDRFQGKEKNIIITSLVRNNETAKASKHVVTFERINVAFSRAQELLFIVGAKHMYEGIKVELPNMDMPGYKTAFVYKNIMDDLHRKACFQTSNKIVTPELQQLIYAEYKRNRGK